MEKIEINKEWLSRLVELVDELALATDDLEKHGFISHLMGYVHSLDEHLK